MTFGQKPRPVKLGNIAYSNPRGMPERWVQSYLERDPKLLALDVMRAFDESWKAKQELQREKLKRWIVTAALVALWEIFKAFLLHR